MSKQVTWLIVLIFLFKASSWGAETDVELTLSTKSGGGNLSVGDTVRIALKIEIPEKYHLYSNPLGPGIGKPLQLKLIGDDRVAWFQAKSEAPEKFIPEGMEDLWTWSFEDSAFILFEGLVEKSLTSSYTGTLIVDGLVCKTACIPVYTEHEFTLEKGTVTTSVTTNTSIPFEFVGSDGTKEVDSQVTTATKSEGSQPETASKVESTDGVTTKEEGGYSIPVALFLAFLAGVILNFMPCVLPVLGIKILSFSKGREGSKMDSILHSIAFAVGMILVFLILASFAAFAGMSWGQQFQNPIFMISVISMIFVFALGMFDVFIILVPSKVSEMEMKSSKDNLWGNFLKGVFATILATPCSGPLLGATLAWTLTQPPSVIYLVFLFLGLGMASPYILLASSDRLSRLVPKPGAWMDDFKHFLGFFLFAFAVYLLSTLRLGLVIPTVGLQVVLAFGVILYTKVAPFGSSLQRKLIAGIIVLVIIVGGVHLNYNVLFNNDKEIVWNGFSQEEFDNALIAKEDIIIDFTAKWCLNCQTNKGAVYNTDRMKGLIKDKNIYAIRADLTQKNDAAEKLRDKLGSRSIPFLVLIPKGDTSKAVRLRDIVTPGQVYGTIDELFPDEYSK